MCLVVNSFFQRNMTLIISMDITICRSRRNVLQHKTETIEVAIEGTNAQQRRHFNFERKLKLRRETRGKPTEENASTFLVISFFQRNMAQDTTLIMSIDIMIRRSRRNVYGVDARRMLLARFALIAEIKSHYLQSSYACK